MILKAFKIISFLLISVSGFAQNRLIGNIYSSEDSTAVKECLVHLNEGKEAVSADASGRFVFENLSNGTHILHFTSPGFHYHHTQINVSSADQYVKIYLTSTREILSEVTVTDARTDFGMTRLRAVENMGIYEGKKSEVIIPDQLVANVSANNARQVYSRVAGLNIWDNDGGGIQLSIGGRGLDPNRTSNFNTRQNGYDISADALGYPESYYTPPVEAIGKIQIVRGAASLQYGTQFGGLINFSMKSPPTSKKFELTARQTVGSWGFYNAFTSAGGTIGKVSYYTFFQYKRGDGWRSNSTFENKTLYANVNYAFSDKTKLKVDVTHMDYLAQQPGGLTDDMFAADPRQTNRERNWFEVNWNLYALHLDHKFNASTEFNLRVFGLSAYRYSIGFRPSRVDTPDGPEEYSNRDLVKGDFNNWGAEARFLKRYQIGKMPSVILTGARFYDGFNHSSQGNGSNGKDANFNYLEGELNLFNDYRFPNKNVSLFAENIIYLNDKLSITPGVRYEFINTTAKGFRRTTETDLAGNLIEKTYTEEKLNSARNIFLAGLGISYKPAQHAEIYSNISQNYRSITFNDMRIVNPSSVIDPNLEDETGYSIDLGLRSEETTVLTYDVSLFFLNYNNRIGEIDAYDKATNRPKKVRTNIGQAYISGVEAYGEVDLVRAFAPQRKNWSVVLFNNIGLIHSEYQKAKEVSVEENEFEYVPSASVEGNRVEFVPTMNLKSGIRVAYKKLKGSFQYTHLSDQFSDATNSNEGGSMAVVGLIPSYSIMDFSLSYELKKFKIEGSINNLADQMYFTRRATGYPGPGILPADGRSFFVTLQLKL